MLRHRDVLRKDKITASLSRLLGNGLVTSHDPIWKQQRKLVAPSFRPSHIAHYGDVMVDAAHRHLERMEPGERDIHDDMTEITLEIVLRTLFGTLDAETEATARGIATFMTAFEREVRSVWRMLPRWLSPHDRSMRGARADLERVVGAVIEARRASGEPGDDLLGRLLAARDEDGTGMADDQLLDECITLFAAGHETTALALTYALWLVAEHPDVGQALRAEVSDVLGDRRARAVDVPALRLHDAVVRETMRLYPPAWVIGRTPVEPIEVGGHRVDPGEQIMVSPWVVHRDPRWWTEPAAFRPERWSNGETQDLHRFAYLPFGGGPRVCVGNHFAQMEAVLVLATCIQHLRVSTTARTQVSLMPAVTLRPRGGLRLHTEPAG